MKNICFVTPTLKKGGMERVITVLSNQLINKNIKVTIVCAFDNDISYEIDPRVDVIFNKSRNRLRVILFLYTSLKRLKPEVVIGFSEFLNPFTIGISKLNRLKVYVSDRSNPIKKHPLRDRVLKKLTYPFADGIIAQTSFAKSIFKNKNLNKNIFVLNNPLIKINNTKLRPEKKGIIMVGRFAKTKNQKELVKIFKLTNYYEWKLYLVGDGEFKKEVEQLVVELELNKHVIFTGEIENIENYMKKCSIFAFTSLSEGFPNALSEAIAFPLSCIAYNCKAGVSDLIDNHENGFLIREGDATEFENKLKLLMNDSNLRFKMMQNGISNREVYHPNRIIKQLLLELK